MSTKNFLTHTEDSSFLLIYYKVFLFKIKSLEKTLARSFIMFADFNSNKNNDDFLDEFRQKLNNEPDESFEERKNEISRSKNVFVGTVSGKTARESTTTGHFPPTRAQTFLSPERSLRRISNFFSFSPPL